MKFRSALLVVEDIEKSKQFYHDVLDLEIEADFGDNVVFAGGLALQTVKTWEDFIHMKENRIKFGNNTGELYFEEDNMEEFMNRLNKVENIHYVHPLKENPGGQRVVRFYDLDKHIIEVRENLKRVVKCLADKGMSVEDIAERMDVSVNSVKGNLKVSE